MDETSRTVTTGCEGPIALAAFSEEGRATNGYAQGRVYIASFVEGAATDKNAAAGAFEFDLSGGMDDRGDDGKQYMVPGNETAFFRLRRAN